MTHQSNPYAQYGLRGALYSIVDNTRDNLAGVESAKQILTDAIDEALDEGCETSDQIADYLLTSQYEHVTDPDLRFNAILRASEQVGGHMISSSICIMICIWTLMMIPSLRMIRKWSLAKEHPMDLL